MHARTANPSKALDRININPLNVPNTFSIRFAKKIITVDVAKIAYFYKQFVL